MPQPTDSMEIQDGRDNPIFIHSELDDYGLTLVEFRLYARLARRSGKTAAYESVPNMARAFGVNDRTVQRALKLLIAARLISARTRPGYSTVYTLLPLSAWLPATSLPALRKQLAEPSKSEKAAPVVTLGPGVGGDTGAGGVVTYGPGVVVTSGPEEGSPYEGSPPKEIPYTHTRARRARLRAVGAPAGVCVSVFSPDFRDEYADHFKLKEGWRIRSGTGEYDERIASAIRRNNLYRLAATWGTEADAARISELTSPPQEEPKQDGAAAQTLVPFERAAQFVYSMSQVPNYNVSGYIEQMPDITEETREQLREEFLRKPRARTA